MLVAALALSGLALAAVPSAHADPDPALPHLQSISYGGTGCAQGTVGQSIAADRRTATLIFDSFIASTGPEVPATEAHKTCQLNLTITVPPNSARALILSSQARGYVNAASGITATQSSQVQLPAWSGVPRDTSFAGPVARDYVAPGTDVFPVVNSTNVPMIVALQFVASVQVTPSPTDSAQMTLDSFDLQLTDVPLPVPVAVSTEAVSGAGPKKTSRVTFSATVTDGIAGGAVVAIEVGFRTADGRLQCSATTDATGVATCTAAPGTVALGQRGATYTATTAAGAYAAGSATGIVRLP